MFLFILEFEFRRKYSQAQINKAPVCRGRFMCCCVYRKMHAEVCGSDSVSGWEVKINIISNLRLQPCCESTASVDQSAA